MVCGKLFVFKNAWSIGLAALVLDNVSVRKSFSASKKIQLFCRCIYLSINYKEAKHGILFYVHASWMFFVMLYIALYVFRCKMSFDLFIGLRSSFMRQNGDLDLGHGISILKIAFLADKLALNSQQLYEKQHGWISRCLA